MKSKFLNFLVLVLLVTCAGCCPKTKQTNAPSQVVVTSYPSSMGESGVSIYLAHTLPPVKKNPSRRKSFRLPISFTLLPRFLRRSSLMVTV